MDPTLPTGPSSSLQRGRGVVLLGDLADYSRHLADDPGATIATVELYRTIVAEGVAAAAGRLIDFVGDNFLSVFEDARSAMSAAIAICTKVRARPGPADLAFRLGVASGDLIWSDDGRIFGDPVTVAARIQAITERGGINVSHSVFLELDEPGLRLRPLGPHLLKNVPESIRVYRVDVGNGAGPVNRVPGFVPSLAVLPITSIDPLRETADVIRTDLVTGLVRMPGLEVADIEDRGDSDEGPVPARPARYLLESGLHGQGRQLRVYAQVLDTPTMNRVWAGRWEGSADDVFGLADRVTAAVCQAMEVELVVGEPSWIYRSMVDPVQVDRVYRGWHQLAKGTRAGFDNAIALFERVADTAPDLPTGSALAAFAYWYAATSGIAPDLEEALSSAGRHARAGIALDDPTGLSHMVAAALTLYDNGDLETALADARIALEHRPTCDVSYGVEASIERYRGNWEAAIAFAQRAIALSPTIKPWYETTLAGAYYSGERYQEAADTAEPVAAHTGGLEALLLLAGAQEALGLHRRAAATVREAMTRHPDARRSTLARSHPFRDEAALDRWMRHLEAAGMP